MTLSETVSLQKYVDSANQKFSESESRLSRIEGSFQTRMDGKTIGGLTGSILYTVCWLVAFCVFFWYIRGYVDSIACLACFGVALALMAVLLLDEMIGFSYYGKISSYRNDVTQLKNRVSAGKSAIPSDLDTFMKSRADGWRHPLSADSSIPEEAASIEKTINSMESLKSGLLPSLKNALFFAFVIAVTGIGSWALFGTAGEIVANITGESLSSDTMTTLCVIGLLVVEVGMIILAKMWWSHTDCSVTNTTIWVAPLGPILFLVLAAVVTCIVMLVIWVVTIVITIACVVIAGACISGSVSGG